MGLGCGVFQRYLDDEDKEHEPDENEGEEPLNVDRVQGDINATAESIDSDGEKSEEPDGGNPRFHFALYQGVGEIPDIVVLLDFC